MPNGQVQTMARAEQPKGLAPKLERAPTLPLDSGRFSLASLLKH